MAWGITMRRLSSLYPCEVTKAKQIMTQSRPVKDFIPVLATIERVYFVFLFHPPIEKTHRSMRFCKGFFPPNPPHNTFPFRRSSGASLCSFNLTWHAQWAVIVRNQCRLWSNPVYLTARSIAALFSERRCVGFYILVGHTCPWASCLLRWATKVAASLSFFTVFRRSHIYNNVSAKFCPPMLQSNVERLIRK